MDGRPSAAAGREMREKARGEREEQGQRSGRIAVLFHFSILLCKQAVLFWLFCHVVKHLFIITLPQNAFSRKHFAKGNPRLNEAGEIAQDRDRFSVFYF